jgi:hypothetical protein
MANPFENKSNAYWSDGEACVSEGSWNSAAHSLYYAVFQAVYGYAEASGLLAKYLTSTWDPTLGAKRKTTIHEAARRIVEHWRGHGGGQTLAFRRLYAARIKADYKKDDVADHEVSALLADARALREYFINLPTAT